MKYGNSLQSRKIFDNAFEVSDYQSWGRIRFKNSFQSTTIGSMYLVIISNVFIVLCAWSNDSDPKLWTVNISNKSKYKLPKKVWLYLGKCLTKI